MFQAKKLLLCLIVGSVWFSGEDSTGATDAEATSGGYLTEAGAIWVKQESGEAVLTPPWDQHNLHVLELRFDSNSANVWWYRVPDRNIYFALDHRGHDCGVLVWIYYRDKAEHWQLLHYPAKLRGIADAPAGGLPGSATDGGAEATDDLLPDPKMSDPDGGPGDTVPPPSDFRLFPEEPAPGAGDAGDASPLDDFFQPAPPNVPPASDTAPPSASDLFPRESP